MDARIIGVHGFMEVGEVGGMVGEVKGVVRRRRWSNDGEQETRGDITRARAPSTSQLPTPSKAVAHPPPTHLPLTFHLPPKELNPA